MIQIYKIQFDDGAAYVGQTRRSVVQRLADHKCKPVNTELALRLRSPEQNYAVSVISRHRKQQTADDRERAEIAKLTRPINVIKHRGMQPAKGVLAPGTHPPFRYHRRPKKYPRDEARRQACRHCRETKPADRYHTDPSRSSGLASACSACKNRIDAALAKARYWGALNVRCLLPGKAAMCRKPPYINITERLK